MRFSQGSHPLGNGGNVRPPSGVRQVMLQIVQCLCRVPALGMGQAPVAPLIAGIGQQHDQAVEYRDLARCIRAGRGTPPEVAQHARHDFAAGPPAGTGPVAGLPTLPRTLMEAACARTVLA